MYTLIIAEKPSVAQAIAAVVGSKNGRTAICPALSTLSAGVSAIWSSWHRPMPTMKPIKPGERKTCPSSRLSGNMKPMSAPKSS